MLIDISNIGPEGLLVRGEVPIETLVLEGDLKARLSPPRLEARLSRGARGVALSAHVETRVTLTCVRCLAPFEQSVSRDFRLTLVMQDPDPGEDSAEPPELPDDLDLYPVRSQRVDMSDVVREQVDLSLPMNPVCRSDCRGLCPQCGANLNQKTCDCPSRPADPRWEGLAAWQQSGNEP
jgi:uncharacterized protein